MITRYAIFNGTVKDGQEAAMRAWVTKNLAPLWRQFACAEEVQVLFGAAPDPNGPPIPLMLAITYADDAAMEKGLNSPARFTSRDLLPALYDQFFDQVQLWHYVMDRAE
jgi:hypothetical protein